MPAAESDIRQQIVAEARRYLGVRFQHQGRAGHPGQGIDCVGLTIAVGNALGLLDDYDMRNYARNPNPRILRRELYEQMVRIPVAKATDGDWYYMRFARQPQHVAMHATRIIAGEAVTYLIHCYAEAGKCVEHRMNDKWRARIVEAWRYKGLAA